MLEPSRGMVFVIEDQVDNVEGHSTLKDMGFVDASEKRAGVTGVVMAVNDEEYRCPHCEKGMFPVGIKKGDRIIYSQFTAEQLDVRGDDGKTIERLKCVPVDSVLGFLR